MCISTAAAQATFSPPKSLSGVNGPIETWGVSSVDLNNDYCADLFFGNHRLEPTVYLGRCDGTFESRPDLVVGDNINVDAHSTVFGDFRNIGCADAHISVGGGSKTKANHANQFLLGSPSSSGGCSGELVRQVGSDAENPEQRGRSAVPLDIDYDGDLDLVTTGYKLETNGAGVQESIFLNDGTGDLLLAPASLTNEFGGHGLTVFNILADIDGDSELDLVCGESKFPNSECSKDVRASFASGSLLSQNVSLNVRKTATNIGDTTRLVVDAFAEDIDGDGDNDFVALRRDIRSGNAGRLKNNTVVEGLNTTSSKSPLRCLGIPGAVDIDSLVITGDYIDSSEIRFGQIGSSQNLPTNTSSSIRRYDFGSLTRAANLGMNLPNTTDGVDENERGTYVGYIEAEKMWRICDVTGYQPDGVNVTPQAKRTYNKYGFRIEFSGAVGELEHEGYTPGNEALTPVVWTNNGDSGNGTEFENKLSNGGIDKPVTAFGLGKGDFDNDGDMDFIASYEDHGKRGLNYLYTNDGSGNFEQSRFNGCPTGIAESIAIADVNDDGFLDPVISCAWFGVAHQTNHAHSVWLNNTSNGNKAIMFSMVGNSTNKDGIGAQIRVTDAKDRSQTVCTRDVGNTFGRGSQDSEFVHCGVAKRSLVDVIVDWPGGLGQNIYNDVSTAAFYRLEEGSNAAELVKPIGTDTAAVDGDLPVVEATYRRINEDGVSARILIRLDDRQFNTTDKNIEVDYTTVDGTATAGLDYGAISGTAVIVPGKRFFIINIPIFTDLKSEPSEKFSIELSNPVGATINPVGGVIQIDNVN